MDLRPLRIDGIGTDNTCRVFPSGQIRRMENAMKTGIIVPLQPSPWGGDGFLDTAAGTW